MKKALVINLFGGPGCGKSTTMARIFADLKIQGYNTEMVSEFAKDLVYEQRQETMKDELYIFAKQHHRMFRVNDKVDIIITDRPLLLTNVYASLYLPDDEFRTDLMKLVNTTFSGFVNINILLDREGVEYQTEGRLQDLEQSQKIDDMTKNELKKNDHVFKVFKSTDYEGIMNYVKMILNAQEEMKKFGKELRESESKNERH